MERQSLVKVLMHVEKISREEAIAQKSEMRERLFEAMEEGEDPHEVIQDEYGLEPDYLDELIF